MISSPGYGRSASRSQASLVAVSGKDKLTFSTVGGRHFGNLLVMVRITLAYAHPGVQISRLDNQPWTHLLVACRRIK